MTQSLPKPVADAQRLIAGLSRFLDGWCETEPERLAAIAAAGRLGRDGSPLPDQAPAPGDTEDFATRLRVYRDESLAVVAWRDLAGLDSLEDTLAALSELADRCINAALLHAETMVAERYGALRDEHGNSQRLIVIGMGKLGGRELNFSSDIDLIFAYRVSGSSDGARQIDADDYFKRVARALVQCLAETTAAGFVYRVDTRLRPFGDAGRLVASIGAMEVYYQAHGREWERYAWIKARPVAGDIEGGKRLIERLRPFVYRRYLDYGTFESIRDMKALVDRQVARADLQDNIKLGRGGIREIEFIVQAFQLIRGGPEPALQNNRLLPTLARLGEADHLPPHVTAELESAYRFLRRTENRLQMADDRQTHELPRSDEARTMLARSMGFTDWPAFSDALAVVRENVADAFEQVFASPQARDEAGDRSEQQLMALWEGTLDDDQAAAVLGDYGIDDVQAVRHALADLRNQSLYRALGDRGRRWISRLVPLLFAAAARAEDPVHALVRTLCVLAAIVGRSTYIALLVEHPAALSMLMRLCAASAWITARITDQPALLDSLLDPRQLFQPPRRAELAASLDEQLAVIDEDDLEQRMDVLRRFAQGVMLRIAAADVSRSMPLMIVSDNLTELAEVVLNAALSMAWHAMSARYGMPRRTDGTPAPFTVIAYGKLGGLELGYTSDLDLVFVYEGEAEQPTDGERSLTTQAFFTRLAQRLIHILSTQTAAGRAYEIDMRLRPSGKSGLMVNNIEAFARYQNEHAWTWEHQALVRARPVAGDEVLGARFSALREEILVRERDVPRLAAEVRAMRERMREVKDESTTEALDVKQMSGGLIDIEFMAQFAALRYGRERREVVRFTDAIRILETLESAGIISYVVTRTLTQAYREYRRLVHAQALQQQRTMISADALADMRAAVAAQWEDWIEAVAGATTAEEQHS